MQVLLYGLSGFTSSQHGGCQAGGALSMPADELCMVRYIPDRHAPEWQQQTACTRAAFGLFLISIVMLDEGFSQSMVVACLAPGPAWAFCSGIDGDIMHEHWRIVLQTWPGALADCIMLARTAYHCWCCRLCSRLRICQMMATEVVRKSSQEGRCQPQRQRQQRRWHGRFRP